jgi:hypothetical protein
MNDLEQVLAVGTLLIVENGEYSDQTWEGPVRVVRAFKKADVAARFIREWAPTEKKCWRDKNDPSSWFLPWLVKEGYVEHCENVHSWHVGSYGKFKP